MTFQEWCRVHQEVQETGFLKKLKGDERRYTALCKLNYLEKTWDNIMLPANSRFVLDEERKARIKEQKKEAQKGEKKAYG